MTDVVVIQGKAATADDHAIGIRPLDLNNRDPLGIHDPATFKVAWEDVFAEPHPGVYSFDWVWKISFSVFNIMRLWTYRILSICGIISACCFGCEFGCQACCIIWCWMPSLKLWNLQLGIIKQAYVVCIETFCAPCIRAISMLLWNIRITVVKSPSHDHTIA